MSRCLAFTEPVAAGILTSEANLSVPVTLPEAAMREPPMRWSRVIASMTAIAAGISSNPPSNGQVQPKVFRAQAAPVVANFPNAPNVRYSFVVDGQPIDWVSPAAPSSAEDDSTGEDHLIRIDDTSLNHLIFANATTDEAVREKLVSVVRDRITSVDRICKLTEQQKRKLALAGLGDIRRLLRRVTELRVKYQSKWIDALDIQGKYQLLRELTREAQSIRDVSVGGGFLDESLYVKTLRNCLTADQSASLLSAKLPSSVVVTHSALLKPKIQIIPERE